MNVTDVIVAIILSGVYLYSLKKILEFIQKEIEKKRDWEKLRRDQQQLDRKVLLNEVLGYKKYNDTMNREAEKEKWEKLETFGKAAFQQYTELKSFENTTVYDHLKALDHIIDKEFVNFVVLPRVGVPDKPLITDIEACAKEIGQNVIGGLNERYYHIFEVHGLTEDYIFRYIVRECTAKLIQFNHDARKKDET